jgi:deoxyribodipyrimidine photolyase-related protein
MPAAIPCQLVLGNQLVYPWDHLDIAIPVVMMEHKTFCADIPHHRIKIAFFFAAMRHYAQALREHGYTVCYQAFDPDYDGDVAHTIRHWVPGCTHIRSIEIVDRQVATPLRRHFVEAGMQWQTIPSPLFIQSTDHFVAYTRTVKKPFMKTYYERVRRDHGWLMENGKPCGGQYSFDAMNRKPCPRDCVIPPRSFPPHSGITQAVIQTVNTHFTHCPGDACDLWLPVTRADALAWWADVRNRYMPAFGDYEDAIDTRDDFLFHSALAPLLNCGLLSPTDIITDDFLNQSSIPLNAREGFLRQVVGWREFIRGIDYVYGDTQHSMNFFDHHRQLRPCWWTGDTGHRPLDDAIRAVIRRGYTHHINRLMVIGATMLMCEVSPRASYDWFMALFVDASEWVMGPNVFGMSQYSDGGLFATKPYLCGSNYIRRMSHYPDGDWCPISDGLYWRFVANHADFLAKNARMGLAVRQVTTMAAERKQALFRAAEAFIKRVTC